MEKEYFGYIRVSTAKQGEKGVSLQEQKDAISQHARRYMLTVHQWFEERESAAKRGRPIFTQMLKQLRQGKANGVIIHKIDRGARNLKDWADLGELIDSGVDVHFANESLDLNTRGGRLSADIQAVVSADYIRNLREETKKGFYGRLKQGLYPLPAPIGYVDRGKGKVKEPDLTVAPMIARLFELYGTSQYSLPQLLAKAKDMGLRNRIGGTLSLNGLSTILNNPFYMGLLRVRRTAELFPGGHQPLISKTLFDRVQSILRGKTVTRVVRHNFAFRKAIRCALCCRTLIGELQKGHVYYRCQTKDCPTKTVREEAVDAALIPIIARLNFDDEELEYVRAWTVKAHLHEDTFRAQELQRCKMRLDTIDTRLTRLTDALIDGLLEKPLFEERKASLIREKREVTERIVGLHPGNTVILRRLEQFLELVKDATLAYQRANSDEKRALVKNLTSNLLLADKNVSVELKPSIRLITNRPQTTNGAPSRGVHRTWDRILKGLHKMFVETVDPRTLGLPAEPETEALAA